MKWLKRIGLIFTAALIVFLILYNVPWRYKIDTSIEGIQSRISDKDYTENVTITVKGVYKQYLFKEDIFDGIIAVDKYDFTSKGSALPYRFNNGFSTLIYINNIDGKPSSEFLGSIVCPPDFGQLLILVDEPIESDLKSQSSKKILFISAPAENRNQAIAIAKTLSEKQGWTTNWE